MKEPGSKKKQTSLHVSALLILFIVAMQSYAQDFNKNFVDSLNPLYETKLLRLAKICADQNDSVNFMRVSHSYLQRYHDRYQVINFLFDYKTYTYKNSAWQKQKDKAVREFLSGLPADVDTALFMKLMLIESEDQYVRLDPSLSKSPIDTANIRHLKTVNEIIRRGKDSKKYLTKEGMTAMFLVIQHIQDPKLQKSYMDTITKWNKQNEIQPGDYAIYIDRTLVHEGKNQIYGSQYHVEGEKLVFYPIENKSMIDTRRKAMHLGPIKDYITMMEMFEKKKAVF